MGKGKTLDDIVVSLVYNIGKDNLNYSGDFNAVNITVSGLYGLGLTGGHSWTPGDFGRHERAYSNSLFAACGRGASITYSEMEYLPIYTVDWETGEKTYEAYQYLYHTGDGTISNKFQEIEKRLQDVINALDK